MKFEDREITMQLNMSTAATIGTCLNVIVHLIKELANKTDNQDEFIDEVNKLFNSTHPSLSGQNFMPMWKDLHEIRDMYHNEFITHISSAERELMDNKINIIN